MFTCQTKIKLVILISLLGFMQFSYADNKDDVSLEQASESIRKESKGQVLSATTNNHNGVKSHRIQVLTETGRVKVYQVPANKRNTQRNHNNRNNHNSSNNYRNRTPNNTNNHMKPSSQHRQSRSHYNRNSFNQSNSNKHGNKSQSNGDHKKK